MGTQQQALGNVIRENRIKKGWTQQELGRMLGVTKNAVYRYEKGLVDDIPLDKRVMLYRLFSIPINLLDFDASLTADQTTSDLANNPQILKYAFEANRMTNLYLQELHNSNAMAPFLMRDNYILIDRLAYTQEDLAKIIWLAQNLLKVKNLKDNNEK